MVLDRFDVSPWKMARVVAIAFTLTHCVSLSARAQGSFSDVRGHWAQTCIQELKTRGIFNGYPDGTFRPNLPVTRAEFATAIDTAFADITPVREAREFVDVPARDWAHPAIRAAYRTGFLSGYPGGRFNPRQKITRVQALVGLASGLQYSPRGNSESILTEVFDDAEQIPGYARLGVAAATQRRLAVNYPNPRQLNGDRFATRAEIAAFLCQALMGYQSPLSSEYIARAPIPIPTSEIRGVWLTNIDSDVLFTRRNLSRAMERLAELNFNTVYPTVWNWGYTLYPSEVAERATGRSVRLVTPIDEDLDPDYGTRSRDMLQEAIEQARDRGLRVIPWFEFGFMAPADSPLAKRHPHWITNRRDGTQVKMEGIHPRVWLNPFHPEVQQFILDLVLEIVTNYDIDGIQFDDHLGLPSEYGYDDYTVELYKQEHNGNPPPNDPKDPEWLRWRANKITEFKARLFRAIKDRNSEAIVALSPNPQKFSYEEFLADWETWERRGLVEEIVLQVYRDDMDRFIDELQQPEVQAARENIPVGVGILTGLKGRPMPLDMIREKVDLVRNMGFAGVSFFFYESMWKWADETPEEREAGFAEIFPTPATRPSVIDNWEGD
ncbi:glycoside hydrolase family 10 protein [Phormidium sp. CCY1219]|uniref:glycoside hydrolase family 10 protein n=1 Tax=Phormidium sp. CCY1219 TaxID=2886104 RepID=UPI002D1F2745|nr:family 10 glycosylhydrolase [Phormidium sp. CCY1219]MEB3827645.1 family 10 glycosylhydrolase [Phormidium sp. CCY1219]